MGNPRGFLEVQRKEAGYRPAKERVKDFNEVETRLSDAERKEQASRCMECGVPFCHWACPVSNVMPEWQDAVYHGEWQEAYDLLQSTNNFPEFTGRVCPALCEAGCVLGIDGQAVTIRQNELAVIEKAFESGYVISREPKTRSGKKVAVIGGGPAGLAAADSLNRAGHNVTLFESEDKVGGYLRFGIPDFKLEKKIIDRRVDIMVREGVEIKVNCLVGTDIAIAEIEKDYDAVCLAIGAREPRDLPVEGRMLKGVHFALDYLVQQNKIIKGDKFDVADLIDAKGKNVLVIGGGDTGSDCVGTANRQGAKTVTQIEIMPKPSEDRTDEFPWPLFPKLLKSSSSHLEGCNRDWNLATKRFIGNENGEVSAALIASVDWSQDETGKWAMSERSGSESEIEADLVLLAMGFLHPIHDGLMADLNIEKDNRGNINVDENYMSSRDGIFAAGDAQRGASLVVWGIKDGQEAAKAIDKYLQDA